MDSVAYRCFQLQSRSGKCCSHGHLMTLSDFQMAGTAASRQAVHRLDSWTRVGALTRSTVGSITPGSTARLISFLRNF